MKATLKIGKLSLDLRIPLIPIRLRLQERIADADPSDILAIAGATIAACAPALMDGTAADDRREIRSDPIDFGERVIDHLVNNGARIEDVVREGSALLLESLRDLPTDQDLEESAGNSEARADLFMPSTSAPV